MLRQKQRTAFYHTHQLANPSCIYQLPRGAFGELDVLSAPSEELDARRLVPLFYVCLAFRFLFLSLFVSFSFLCPFLILQLISIPPKASHVIKKKKK
jgi:hypothetical protein